MILAYQAIKKHRAAKARARAQNIPQSQQSDVGIVSPQTSLSSKNGPQHLPSALNTEASVGHRDVDIDTQDSNELKNDNVAQISPNPPANESSPIKWREVWDFWKIVVALALPVFLETLDYTIVATAQPTIASYFNRLDLQSYIGTVYLLTSTVFLPLYATLSDVFGRYFAMQTALIFFLLGSAISTGARNIVMILAGRGISGIGAAGILAVVRVILSDSSSLDANNRLAAIFIILYTPGYALGPTIGGALTQKSWRWVFAINLPILVVSMINVFLLLRNNVKGPQPSRHHQLVHQVKTKNSDQAKSVSSSAPPSPSSIQVPSNAINNTDSEPNPEDETGTPKMSILRKLSSVDFPGAVLFVTGFIIILLALNWGSTSSEWDTARVIVCFVVGGCLVISCFLWEWTLERHQMLVLYSLSKSKNPSQSQLNPKLKGFGFFWQADPMIPLNVFTSYDVCATLFGAFGSGMVMFVLFYFISIFMTIVTGLSSFKAGVQLLYFTPGLAGGSFLGSILIKVMRQPKYPCILGSAIITISNGLIARAMDMGNQAQINGFLAMAGIGVGMTFGPLMVHARFSQPSNRVAVVVALNLFARTIGGTIGLAQCATILNAKVNSYLSAYVAQNVNSGIPLSSLSNLTSGSLSSVGSISSLPPEVQDAVRSAFRRGVYWCFISLIPWNGLATISLMFLSRIPDTDKGESFVSKEGKMSEVETPPAQRQTAQNDSDGQQLELKEKSLDEV